VTRFDAPVSPHRVFGAMEFPLSKVKEIRAAMPGATVNDIAMAIFSRALRKYLGDKNELPEASLIANLPVSLRKQGSVDDKANAVSFMFFPLHTDIEDPIETLEALQETITKHKSQRLEIGESMFVQMMSNLPTLAQAALGRIMLPSTKMGFQFSPANMAVSNVPGPPTHTYFAGAKAIKAHGVGILVHGAGLSNVVSRYLDEMTISFISCRVMMPDPENYEAAIREGFDEIYDAAMAKAAKSEAKKAAPKKKSVKKNTAKGKTA